MSKRGCFTFLIAIAMIISALLALPLMVFADNDDVTMEVEVGFDSHFNMQQWTPVVVDIENKGPDIDGWLEAEAIQQDGTAVVFSTKAVIPQGSKKRITLYMQFSTVQRNMQVRLMQQDKAIKQIEVKNLYPMNYNQYLMGVLTDDKDALNYWWQKPGNDGLFTYHETIHLNAESFPDRKEVLDNFTALIINNFDTGALSQKQIDALNVWIDSGGLLIVGTGPNGQKVMSGLTDKVIPLRSGKIVSVAEIPVLDTVSGVKNHSDAPFQLMEIEADKADEVVNEGDNCIIAKHRKGDGYIFISAFDLGLEPITGWAGNQALWDNILAKQLDVQRAMYMRSPDLRTSIKQNEYWSILQALQNIKAMDIPSINGLIILLLIYLAVVGPINYFVLKRFDKREWMWFTIPLLVLAFSGGIYAAGYTVKGDDVITNTISVINIKDDGNAANVDNYIGVFMPRKGDYTISTGKDVLLAINGNDNFDPYNDPYARLSNSQTSETARIVQAKSVQGDPAYIEMYNASVWIMKTFSMKEVIPQFGGFKTDLYYRDGKISGTITNTLPYPVEDMAIYTPYAYQIMGNMASGETKDVSIQIPVYISYNQNIIYSILDELYPNPNGNGNPTDLTDRQREMMARRSIMENIAMPGLSAPYTVAIGPGMSVSSQTSVSASVSPDDGFLKVFAFIDQKITDDIKVNGQIPATAYHTNVITGGFDVNFERNGIVNLPPGVINPYIDYRKSGSLAINGEGINMTVFIERGMAIFGFDMGGFADADIDKVHIDVPIINKAQGSAIKLFVYDNDKKDYVESGKGLSISSTSSGSIDIEGDAVDRFINDDGVIEIAVNAVGMEIQVPAIAMEGRKR
ncbi:hypothetical protein [Mahella sp.]|uniref:hypothetical protein n=1 Tax=Mahella sp. TaxID=2798721 RepID=UPI0025C6508B|nr:hypothetical protein [Mahella sp.]MBZ4664949.1 hypothetical protein [Mahella sp.]